MRAIGQGGGVDAASVSEASRAVAALHQSLQEMQQGQVRDGAVICQLQALHAAPSPCAALLCSLHRRAHHFCACCPLPAFQATCC